MFLICSNGLNSFPTMSNTDENLPDADPADLTQALAFALCFSGRKRIHSANELMARITAERLVEHLELSGFVVKKKVAGRDHSTGHFVRVRGESD
jgi:hypothetical protein